MAGPDQTTRQQLIHHIDEASSALRDWTRTQIATTGISFIIHLALILLLMLVHDRLKPAEDLRISARFGDPKSLDGEMFVTDTTRFEPLQMPSMDVTRIEPPIDLQTIPPPDLPSIEFKSPPAFPAASQATEKDTTKGFGFTQFDGIAEKVQGVSVKIGDPQFTLIWDTDADLDLHVIEPGGSEIYWEFRKGDQGGELDVDDVEGLGPENIFWKKTAGPRGDYHWWVHYYGGLGGKVFRTKWQVRIKHDGQVETFDGVISKIDGKSTVQILHK